VENLISKTHSAYLQWKTFSFQQRGDLFRKLGALLRKDKETFATLITVEMYPYGKLHL